MKYKLLILITLTLIINACTVTAVEPKSSNADAIRQAIYDKNNKRKNIRICKKDLAKPIQITNSSDIDTLIDISAGGIGFKPKRQMKDGEIIPVAICYNGIKTDAKVKVIFVSDNKIGAEFIKDDKEVANKLLLIGIMLESDNGLLITDLDF